MITTFKQTVFILFCLVLLSSCSSSKLLTTWETKNAAQYISSKILVIGVSQDETKRRIYEDTFTDSLQAMKVNAVPSYAISKRPIEPTEGHLRQIIERSKCSSVLLTHMVSESEKDFYQPSSIIVGTNNLSSYGLYGYYPFIHRSVYSGSYVSTTKVVLETTLYDVETEKRIWSARSESIDPVMTKKYYQQLINLFLSDLRNKQIL